VLNAVLMESLYSEGPASIGQSHRQTDPAVVAPNAAEIEDHETFEDMHDTHLVMGVHLDPNRLRSELVRRYWSATDLAKTAGPAVRLLAPRFLPNRLRFGHCDLFPAVLPTHQLSVQSNR
jgi:hypothetical protein